MRFPALRLSLSTVSLSTMVLTSLVSLSRADLEYQIKTEDAGLFRKITLEPPPLAVLEKGESLRMIKREATQSLVVTSGGLRGWVRNQDLLAMKVADNGTINLADQKIKPDDFNHTFDVGGLEPSNFDVVAMDRSFTNEVVEPMDREQVEMRHDEN